MRLWRFVGDRVAERAIRTEVRDEPAPVVGDRRLGDLEEGPDLERARELQGLERLEEIKYAVLERDGVVSVIPRR
jgi:hypothetical protein